MRFIPYLNETSLQLISTESLIAINQLINTKNITRFDHSYKISHITNKQPQKSFRLLFKKKKKSF